MVVEVAIVVNQYQYIRRRSGSRRMRRCRRKRRSSSSNGGGTSSMSVMVAIGDSISQLLCCIRDGMLVTVVSAVDTTIERKTTTSNKVVHVAIAKL